MDWLHPSYLWAAAAAPVVVALFLWAAWKRRQALKRFASQPLVSKLTAAARSPRRGWRAALVAVGVLLLALALAGPRYGKTMREVEREGVDLVIALDVSLSMQAEDIAPSRLERAKKEIKQLLGELSGSRVGLVVFAGDAFIQCPLTTDYSAVRLFLDVVDPSLIPVPGTDFTAALQKTLQAFETSVPEGREEARTRAVLFVSDGENHTEDLSEAVKKAEEADVTLFAAGVGEKEGTPIPVYRNGRQDGYKKDRSGSIVQTRLQEAALRTLAEEGSYLRIARTSGSLQQVVPALNRLKKTSLGAEQFEEYNERYQWPLALALLLLVVERLVTYRRRSGRHVETYEGAKA